MISTCDAKRRLDGRRPLILDRWTSKQGDDSDVDQRPKPEQQQHRFIVIFLPFKKPRDEDRDFEDVVRRLPANGTGATGRQFTGLDHSPDRIANTRLVTVLA